MWFKNRQRKIEAQLAEYRKNVALCMDHLRKAFKDFFATGDIEQLRADFGEMHRAESMADDMRRDIEVVMYSEALFPESRGDILGLLETADRVPNQAESSVRMLLNQHVKIPEAFHSTMLQLVEVSHRCVRMMLDGMAKVFSDFANAAVFAGKVDELESEADNLEVILIEQVFSSDMDGFDKLLLRDLIKHIAQISDRAENVGDRIRIIVAKRRT